MRVSQDFNRHQALMALYQRLSTATTNGQLHVALFSGTPPTDEQLQALLDGTAAGFTWSAARLASFATSANFLADIALDVTTATYDPVTMQHVIPCSQQATNMVVAANGTPTWFLMRLSTVATTGMDFVGFTSAGVAYVCVTGTVGDENSNADLRIKGGTVSTGVQIRPMDFRFKF